MGLFKKSKHEEPVDLTTQQKSKVEESCNCNQTEESCNCNQTEGSCNCNNMSSIIPDQGQSTEEKCQSGCSCAGGCEDSRGSRESSASGISDSGIIIKILGSGCKSCIQLYENVNAALEEMGLQAEVVKVTDFAEITGYGVMSTPAIVFNEQVVSYGKVLKPAEVKKLLERYL